MFRDGQAMPKWRAVLESSYAYIIWLYFQVIQSKFTKKKIKQAIGELKKANPSVQLGCFIAENEACKNLLKLLGAENNSVNRKKLGRQYSMVSL